MSDLKGRLRDTRILPSWNLRIDAANQIDRLESQLAEARKALQKADQVICDLCDAPEALAQIRAILAKLQTKATS